MIPLETERLLIRRMSESDLDDFLAYQTHPEVMRYQPYEPATRESAARFLAKQSVVEPDDAGAHLAFAVHHRRDDKTIGEVIIDFSRAMNG